MGEYKYAVDYWEKTKGGEMSAHKGFNSKSFDKKVKAKQFIKTLEKDDKVWLTGLRKLGKVV